MTAKAHGSRNQDHLITFLDFSVNSSLTLAATSGSPNPSTRHGPNYDSTETPFLTQLAISHVKEKITQINLIVAVSALFQFYSRVTRFCL